jgi:diguanylate cyclase (GGDEF)-like protein
VPFAVAGLLRFVPAGAGRLGLRSLLDGCVVAISTLFVGWALALGPALRGGDVNLLSHVVTVAYPLTDVVLAALAVLVVQWSGTEARRSIRLVAVAFVLMAVADTAFTWMISQGTYVGDALVTMLWPASYLVVALGARAEERREVSRSTGPTSVLAVLLPFIPLAAAVVVGVARLAGGQRLGPFLGVAGLALVVLVLMRQTVTAWELRSTVVALHEREEELARLALTDALTGLANRAHFGERLEAVAVGSRRPAVVYVDLDGFKGVNDTYGHAVGDRLLVAAADRLRASATPSMLVARLGGDEFVVLVEDGHDAAVNYAQRVIDAFRMPFQTEGAVVSFQASVGVATVPLEGSAEEAVRRADAAMYVAKTTGKGRAVDYPDEAILAV